MSFEDHYATLGVSPDASDAEIAAAFEARRGVEGAEAAFRVLGDPTRRMLYDELRRREALEAEPEPAPELFDLPANDPDPTPKPEAAAEEPLVVQPTAGVPRRRGPPAIWGLAVIAAVAAVGLWAWLRLAGTDEPPPPPVAEAPPAPVGTPLAANTLHEWSESPTATTYSIDGLVLTLEARGPANERRPVLRVTAPGGETFEQAGESGLSTVSAHFGVGRLDPSSPAPQVVFTSFSGGAHCCTRITILDLRNGAWRAIDLGAWDGDGLGAFPRDENGDGRPELVMVDNRFLYAFASYAESYAPPQILQMRDGQMVDASAEPGYRDLYLARAGDLQAACRKGGNGACAAFAAVAARLGQIETAWPTLLDSYDASSDWTLPSACRAVAKSECPPDEEVTFATFPESLRWFLGETGFTPPVPLPRREPGVGPAFDCTKVRSNNLRLICTDQELSAADRELDRVYLRALALTRDVAGLRNQENAFISVRNNAPLDRRILLGLYQARIADLEAGLEQR